MTRPTLPQLSIESRRVLEDYRSYLLQRRYSENTIHSYAECLAIFIRFHNNIQLSTITIKDIEQFNSEYIIKNSYSTSFQNQVINALKTYFSKRLHMQFDLKNLERPKKSKRLPIILSLSEVEHVLNVTTNIKHLSMLVLIYSSGLRSGELINLRITDVDSERMIIHIKGAKGKKDRIVPLAHTTLHLLREYFKAYRPREYLFNGEGSLLYSKSSLQAIFRKACRLATIQKRVTLHSLRHSYATHLLEEGVNLRYIQEILGHSSSKTTEIYTHVTSESARKVTSPIEKITLNKINNTQRGS